ncbi:MAG: NAD-dependent epimerase/dehydratase family protein [Terracidiphilus sp.]
MARLLVTGGSGFIGTNLIASCLEDGWEIMNYDCTPPRNTQHGRFFRNGEILDGNDLTAAVRDFRPEFVVHLAARTDLDGPTLADYSANTAGAHNMVAAIRAVGTVRRAVFASSRYVHKTGVFPRREDAYSPFTKYGESKVEVERIVRTSGLEIPWVLVRPTSIWGPWFRIPYRMFFDTVRRGVYVHPKGRRISKSYGYVGNVVYQIRKFLSVDESKVNKRTFYVSDDGNMDVLEFARLIQKAFGAPPVREAPLSVLKALAYSGDLLKKLGVSNPPLTSFRLGNLLTPMDYDMSATIEAVGHAPYSLEQGVRATVDWILQHG